MTDRIWRQIRAKSIQFVTTFLVHLAELRQQKFTRCREEVNQRHLIIDSHKSCTVHQEDTDKGQTGCAKPILLQVEARRLGWRSSAVPHLALGWPKRIKKDTTMCRQGTEAGLRQKNRSPTTRGISEAAKMGATKLATIREDPRQWPGEAHSPRGHSQSRSKVSSEVGVRVHGAARVRNGLRRRIRTLVPSPTFALFLLAKVSAGNKTVTVIQVTRRRRDRH
jgi:hypothetical protein